MEYLNQKFTEYNVIFAAKISSQGTTPGTFLVTPQYTRVDGVAAPDIEALPVNGLVPAIGDIVYCAEGINDFTPSMQLLINDNGGAFPLIFASTAATIEVNINLTVDGNFIAKGNGAIQGKATLGAGGKKMVLGDPLATFIQSLLAWATAINAWGLTVTPPFPGTPALPTWDGSALSQNHQLD